MKKLIAAILTAFLMSAGLVATTSSTSVAADCPYSGCIKTGTTAVGLNAKAKRKAKLFVGVSSFGNGAPTGTLQVTFIRKNGKSVTFSRPYPSKTGRKKIFNFRPLAGGKYTVLVNFIPDGDTIYEGSADTTTVKVKGGRRR